MLAKLQKLSLLVILIGLRVYETMLMTRYLHENMPPGDQRVSE